jgi:hypothetical protein
LLRYILMVERLVSETSQNLASFLCSTILGKPARSLRQERGEAKNKTRKQHLASDGKAPLEARVRIESGETKPRSDSDTDDDEG